MEFYYIYNNDGCEVFSVDYDDSDPPSTQGYYKFTYYGRVLGQRFLDGNMSDANAWDHSGYVPINAVVGVNGIVYYHDVGYDHDGVVAAIERTIYGAGSDTDAPYVDSSDPGDGDTGVDPNTDIDINLVDDGFGIDVSTLDVQVSYDGKTQINGDLTGDNVVDFLDMDLTFDPDDPLPENTEITVTIWAEDLLGNDDTTTWTFETGDLVGIKSVSIGELKATFK